MRRLLLRAASFEMAIDTEGPAGRDRSSGTRSDAHRISRTSRHGFQSSTFAAGAAMVVVTADEAVELCPTALAEHRVATAAITANRRPFTAAPRYPRWTRDGSYQLPARATSFFLPK